MIGRSLDLWSEVGAFGATKRKKRQPTLSDELRVKVLDEFNAN